jgi:16S rRNA processing protein RimM
LRGALRIEVLLEDDAVFEPGRRVVLLCSDSGEARETEVEFFRRQHGRTVVKFRGIDSISEAGKYIGRRVAIPLDALPSLKEGWFYTFQLRGCRVFTAVGEYVGIVTGVLDLGGPEILAVECAGEEILIPFAQPYMKNIEPDQRRIEVNLPDDLRELNK